MKIIKIAADNAIRRYQRQIAEDILKERQKVFGDDPAEGTGTGEGEGEDCEVVLCPSFDLADGTPTYDALVGFDEMNDLGGGSYRTPTPARTMRDVYIDGLHATEDEHYVVDSSDPSTVTFSTVPVSGTIVTARYTAF
jgi:hypothetical protein